MILSKSSFSKSPDFWPFLLPELSKIDNPQVGNNKLFAKNMNRILAALALFALATAAQLEAQNWLPKEAEVCYRTQYEDGFLPDATFRLKVKVTKEQFDTIVKRLGVTAHTETRKYSDEKMWLGWRPEIGDDLKPRKGRKNWDPDDDLSSTFVRQEKGYWQFLKFEGGFLYYVALNH